MLARGDLRFALVWTLALRIFWSLAAALLASLAKIDAALVSSNQLAAELTPRASAAGRLLLSVWERFDALWYLHIAEAGYDRPDAVVFYPLYPLLIRVLTWIVRSPVAAALLVSTAATFFLMLGLLKLARLDGTAERGVRAALVCGMWPAGFIFLAAYPESLLAACLVWSVYFARRERSIAAGLVGLAAGFAKAVGVVAVVPLLYLAFRKGPRALLPALLPLLAPIFMFGLVVPSAGSATAAAYASYWRTEIAPPWTTLSASVRQVFEGDALVAINLGALVLVLAIVLTVRTRPEHTLFALGAVSFFLLKKTDPLLQSTLRYVLCVYPLYLSLSDVLETRPLLVLAAVSTALLNLALLWHFLNWSLLL